LLAINEISGKTVTFQLTRTKTINNNCIP